MILTPMFGRAGADYASFLELAIIFGVVISAAGLARVLGNQAEPANSIEARIAQKAQAALMAAIFCVTGLAALICCPLAMVYANQALQRIAEGKGGEQYRRQAKAAQAVAIAATALWGMGVIYLVFVRLVPAPV
jgi:hypothetical protein